MFLLQFLKTSRITKDLYFTRT